MRKESISLLNLANTQGVWWIARVFSVSTLYWPYFVLVLELFLEQTISSSPLHVDALLPGSNHLIQSIANIIVVGSPRKQKNLMFLTSLIFSSTCHSSSTMVVSFPGT
jgi:hypothetical protein